MCCNGGIWLWRSGQILRGRLQPRYEVLMSWDLTWFRILVVVMVTIAYDTVLIYFSFWLWGMTKLNDSCAVFFSRKWPLNVLVLSVFVARVCNLSLVVFYSQYGDFASRNAPREFATWWTMTPLTCLNQDHQVVSVTWVGLSGYESRSCFVAVFSYDFPVISWSSKLIN